MSVVTQKELKKILHYNPDTGVFTRLTRPTNSANIGDVAGCVGTRGYIQIMIKYKMYPAHRLAWLYMTGKWPAHQIDHINHTKNDNRWINLREATSRENSKNSPLRKDNASGVVGVSMAKTLSKWQAYITISSKKKHLGYFTDKFEAICCRKSASNKYGFHTNHGAITRISDPKGNNKWTNLKEVANPPEDA